MATGDVTCQVVACNTSDIDTALTNLRVTANDKFLMTDVYNGSKVLICHIEEA